MITATLFAVAASFWFLQIYGAGRPQACAARCVAAGFSAARAEQVLARLLGPEIPHPVSSDEKRQRTCAYREGAFCAPRAGLRPSAASPA